MEKIKVSLRAPREYISRTQKEEPHEYRSEFMRDRDRILYSKTFRRLSGKTQIFLANYEMDARNRLTHTIEVAQIARTICKKLRLNDDLAEAIALAHDIGHTPFGHIGERTLNFIMNGCDKISDVQYALGDNDKGFKHNLQGIRTAIELEKFFTDETALNLCNYTLYGIYCHTKPDWKRYNDELKRPEKCDNYNDRKCYIGLNVRECECDSKLSVDFYSKYMKYMMIHGQEEKFSWSFEAFVVRMSDEIAQRHHDFEDAIITGLMSDDEVIEIIETNLSNCITREEDKRNFDRMKKAKGEKYFVAEMSRFIVNMLVSELCEKSIKNLNNFVDFIGEGKKEVHRSDFRHIYPEIDINRVNNLIQFEPGSDFEKGYRELEKVTKEKVLNSYQVHSMNGKGRYIIRKLFKAYLTNLQQLPDKTIISIYKLYDPKQTKELTSKEMTKLVGRLRESLSADQSDKDLQKAALRVICDFIAGMTDSYAISQYHHLYG